MKQRVLFCSFLMAVMLLIPSQTLAQEPLEVLATITHDDAVRAASFNADETRIATASADGTVKVSDVDGTLVATLDHGAEVLSMRWSGGGTLLLTTSADSSARLWNAEAGLPVATLIHDDSVLGASLTEDEQRILTFSTDNTAKLWANNGTLLATLQHEAAVAEALFSPDESRIVTRTIDGRVFLWDGQGNRVRDLIVPATILGVEWDDASFRLITWVENGEAILWDFNGNWNGTAAHPDTSILDAQWRSDGTQFLTVPTDGTVRLWGLDVIQQVLLQHDAPVIDARWNDDETLIATLTSTGTATLWNVDGTLVGVLPSSVTVQGIFWNEDGTELLTWAEDSSATVWDTAGIPKIRVEHGTEGIVDAVLTKNPEASVLTLGGDGNVNVFTEDGTLRGALTQTDAIVDLRLNGDSSQVLTWAEDGITTLWGLGGSSIVQVTPTPTITPTTQPTSTPTATSPAVTVEVSEPTSTPTPTVQSVIPSSTPASSTSCTFTSNLNANLRSGPGTNYSIAGQLGNGQSQVVIGQASGQDGGNFVWYRLANAAWIRADLGSLSGNCGSIPQAEVPATPTPQPTSVNSTPEVGGGPPANRSVPPAGASLLQGGIGLTNGAPMSNGNFQVENYCTSRGLTAQNDGINWFCLNADSTVNFTFSVNDFDIICQQTYNNAGAFVIQDGSGAQPAFRWRCYGYD